MQRQKAILGVLFLLSWGCRSGTEPNPELVAVGNGGPRQVLTAPEVRVDAMTALATLSLKHARHIPMGINALTEFAGSAYDGEGYYAPVAWRNGAIEILGDPAISGEAAAINDAGQVVGSCASPCTGAALWEMGVPGYRDLGRQWGGRLYTSATDINNDGVVVGLGAVAGSSSATSILRWTAGAGEDLRIFRGRHAYDAHINVQGQVVYTSWLGDPKVSLQVASYFLDVSGILSDLGSLGGTETWARDINAAGQVVGGSTTAGGEMHAFVWEGGRMTDLGTLGGTFSLAYGINELGHVVGESTPPGDGDPHAVIWVEGAIVDLGVLPGSIRSVATGINDRGQIIGASFASCNPAPVVTSPPPPPFLRCSGPATPTNWAVTLVPPSPAELTDRLDEAVASLEADGLVTSEAAGALSAKLDAATAKLNEGNEAGAAGVMRGFIGQLQALVRSRRLDAAVAADLIVAAELALQELEG